VGRTRRRVTVLVLALESIGFVLLAFALWLAGETRLECRPAASSTLSCHFEERRLVYLWPWRSAAIEGVVAGESARGDDLSSRFLVLHGAAGPQRTLLGGAARTQRDVEGLAAALKAGEPFAAHRSDLGWALLSAAFGFIWLIVISLIMREFLGFHTPWWWRLFALPRRET
jgi:hypothetical protein